MKGVAMPEDHFTDTFVTVTRGPHAGKTGYCDEDDGGEAYVYFGRWDDGYEVINPRHLVKASAGDAARYERAFFSTFHARPRDLGH
jgi:hypothetical protein